MLNDIINLIRVRQWYKNLLVFVALVFASKAFSYLDVFATVVGFVSLCLLSGAVYTINDLIDLKKDTANIEKKNRPLPSRRVTVKDASVLSGALLLGSFGLSFLLPFSFTIILIAMLAINLFYSFAVQKILILDVVTIAILLVLRAVAGAFIINVTISPWLLLCTFLLALFLAVAKRKSDLASYASHFHKGEYTTAFLDKLLTICITGLLVSYSIYAFFTYGDSQLFWLSVPTAFFLAFRFLFLVTINNEAAKRAEEVFYDKQMLLGMAVWLVIVIVGIYTR